MGLFRKSEDFKAGYLKGLLTPMSGSGLRGMMCDMIGFRTKGEKLGKGGQAEKTIETKRRVKEVEWEETARVKYIVRAFHYPCDWSIICHEKQTVVLPIIPVTPEARIHPSSTSFKYTLYTRE